MIKKTLCLSNPAYLSVDKSQLIIKMPDVVNSNLPQDLKKEAVRSVPIEDIGVVVLDNKQITITHAVIESLAANNCALISCDSSHLPTGLMLPLEGNTIQSERFQEQIEASVPLKKQMWQQTIQCKIRNQASVLKNYRGCEVGNMLVWAGNVKSGDADNLEGRAAAYYWKNMFPSIAEFTRDREGCPPNNLLNYGYSILRAVVARSLVASGLLPTLGIHHHNRYNAYCLADDVMEPYRPYVDRIVIGLVDGGANIEELDKTLKQQLLSIPVIDVVIAGQRRPLMLAVAQTTSSVAKCFSGESRKLVYPEI